ncbi:MAG: serine hydroxymethyltransferase, partial [Pseudomonadota bacterium]
AYFMVDMAHVAGLCATGHYPNTVPHAHVVTRTTHKTLRGPRGGIILSNAGEELTRKFNSLVFPGTQGGPLMHVIAAKAVAFLEALQPEFRTYQAQVVANARAMAQGLQARGYDIVSGGTDNHLFLVSLVSRNVTGKDADAALGRAHITVNKNAVPNDPRPPMITSGLRLGTPAITTRGFREPEVRELANLIADVLDNLSSRAHLGSPDGKGGVTAEDAVLDRVRTQVSALCARFPVYGGA